MATKLETATPSFLLNAIAREVRARLGRNLELEEALNEPQQINLGMVEDVFKSPIDDGFYQRWVIPAAEALAASINAKGWKQFMVAPHLPGDTESFVLKSTEKSENPISMRLSRVLNAGENQVRIDVFGA